MREAALIRPKELPVTWETDEMLEEMLLSDTPVACTQVQRQERVCCCVWPDEKLDEMLLSDTSIACTQVQHQERERVCW